MKNAFLLLLFVIITACAGMQKTAKQQKKEYEIVQFTVPFENDSVQVNELRFYKIHSALDATRAVYERYGKWNKKGPGTYQATINRMVWEQLKLLEGDERFTVITDGKETTTDYFACISVFDAEGKDCFATTHPLRQPLKDLFVNKIGNLEKGAGNYGLFRGNP